MKPPKPLHYHGTQSRRLPKVNEMTIAAGFPCVDGLVLCADTRETISGYVKTDTEKIRTFEALEYKVVFTGAGGADLLDTMFDEMIEVLLTQKPQGFVQVSLTLKRKAKELYDSLVKPYLDLPLDERPTTPTILIGMQFKAATMFYKAHGATFPQLREAECVGMGIALGKTLIKRLHRFHMSLPHAVLIAIYILRHIKRGVDGCGGNSDIILLPNNGLTMTKFPTDEVRKLEEHFDKFDAAIRPVLISCADAQTEHKDFDRAMTDFAMAMLGLRGKFMEFEEFTRRLCELAGIQYKKPSPQELADAMNKLLMTA